MLVPILKTGVIIGLVVLIFVWYIIMVKQLSDTDMLQ